MSTLKGLQDRDNAVEGTKQNIYSTQLEAISQALRQIDYFFRERERVKNEFVCRPESGW